MHLSGTHGLQTSELVIFGGHIHWFGDIIVVVAEFRIGAVIMKFTKHTRGNFNAQYTPVIWIVGQLVCTVIGFEIGINHVPVKACKFYRLGHTIAEGHPDKHK